MVLTINRSRLVLLAALGFGSLAMFLIYQTADPTGHHSRSITGYFSKFDTHITPNNVNSGIAKFNQRGLEQVETTTKPPRPAKKQPSVTNENKSWRTKLLQEYDTVTLSQNKSNEHSKSNLGPTTGYQKDTLHRIAVMKQDLQHQRDENEKDKQYIDKQKEKIENENKRIIRENQKQEKYWRTIKDQLKKIRDAKETLRIESVRLKKSKNDKANGKKEERDENTSKADRKKELPREKSKENYDSDKNDDNYENEDDDYDVSVTTPKSKEAKEKEIEKKKDEKMEEARRKEEERLRWNGLNPAEVAKKFPGLKLEGYKPLKPFVTSDDPSALGMSGHPQTIEDINDKQAEERFYQLVTQNHIKCTPKKRMGNAGDGGWDFCLATPFAPDGDCIVYSFGINNDFTFDDAIASTYGCQVRAFDPSMNSKDHMHSDNVYFSRLGLGATDKEDGNGWHLKTFGSLLKSYGHDTKVIDYLKIDIEFNEWSCFQTMLREGSLKNVKQFAFEFHTSEVYLINHPSNKHSFWEWYGILLEIEKQGFRRYHNHLNPFGRYHSVRTGKERSCCHELYYVNINFLK